MLSLPPCGSFPVHTGLHGPNRVIGSLFTRPYRSLLAAATRGVCSPEGKWTWCCTFGRTAFGRFRGTGTCTGLGLEAGCSGFQSTLSLLWSRLSGDDLRPMFREAIGLRGASASIITAMAQITGPRPCLRCSPRVRCSEAAVPV